MAFVLVLAVLASIGTVSYYSSQFSSPTVESGPTQVGQASGFLVVDVEETEIQPDIEEEASDTQ